jgi:glutamyl-tRNA synthetase
LRNQDKSKISKRKNPVSIHYYREAGYLPEAMCNYLAMMGWTMPDGREKFGLEDIVEHFDFGRISLGGPVFDLQKLTWLNAQYIRELTPKALHERYVRDVLPATKWEKALSLVQDRVQKLEDIHDAVGCFLGGDIHWSSEFLQYFVPKTQTVDVMRAALEDLCQWLDVQSDVDMSLLETEMRRLCQVHGLKTKELFMAVRVAVTGRTATPPLFETMCLLGKERCRRRLRQCLSVYLASAANPNSGATGATVPQSGSTS